MSGKRKGFSKVDDIPILFGLTPYNDLQHRRDGIDK